MGGVVVNFAASNEARTEHAVKALAQFLVVIDDAFWWVGGIGHDHGNRVALKVFEAAANGKAKAVGIVVVKIANSRVLLADLSENVFCAVLAVVVDDQDIVANGMTI